MCVVHVMRVMCMNMMGVMCDIYLMHVVHVLSDACNMCDV